MTMDKSVLETTRHLPRLSLQEMCLLRIVTTLCNNSQLLDLILKCHFEKNLRFRLLARNESGWEEVEAAADELVSKLCNNALLKRKMMKFLWPVAHRMMRWKHVYAWDIETKFIRQFCWTDRGRINNTKTARCLVSNKNICVRKRFILACCVCIEDEILDIWREMPNEDKEYFYAENQEPTRPLVLFWARILDGSDDVLGKNIPGLHECATKLELLEASKYLLGILGDNKVDWYARSVLAHCFIDLLDKLKKDDCLEEDENEFLYFLFFERTEEGQKELFRLIPAIGWTVLLHSSEYTLCLRLMAERLLLETEFHIIMFLKAVFYTYNLEVVDDDDCGQLFMDVWRLLPTSVRASIGSTHHTAEFLSVLVRDHFPFLLEVGASEKIADKNSEVRQGKWKFLHFLLEEKVTTTPYLKKYRMFSLYILKPKGIRTMIWKNFMVSLNKIRDQIPKNKKIKLF